MKMSQSNSIYDAKRVLEEQNGYRYLDSKPRTISSKTTDQLTMMMVIIFLNRMLMML